MKAPFEAVFVLAAALIVSPTLFAQKGTFRSEFQRATGFAGSPVYSTTPNGGFTSSSGDLKTSFTFAFDAVVPSTELLVQPNSLQLVRFDQPLRPSVSVVVNWKAPFDSNAEKTFNASLKLEAKDWGATPEILLCSQTSQAQTVKQNSNATFSVSLENCSITVLRAFNRSYVTNQTESLFLATLVVEGKDSGGGRLHVHYQSIPNYDSVYAIVSTPSQLNLIRGGSSQGFSGTLYGYPGTRFDADVQMLLVDSALQVLGRSTPARVTRYEISRPFTIAPVSIPLITGDLYLLAVMTVPDSSSVLATYPLAVHVEECALRGLIRRSADGRDFWLPDVPVILYEHPSMTELGRTQSRQTGTFEHPKSEYCFTGAQLPAGWSPAGKNVQPVAVLQDAPEGDRGTIVVSETAASAGTPIKVAWTPFSIANFNRRDLNVSAQAGAVVSAPQTNVTYAEAGAEIYWHMWRLARVMWPANSTEPLKRNLPVAALVNGPGTFYCPSATAYGPGCTRASTISLEGNNGLPGANPSVLWHEFGHHLVRELYEADEIPRPAASDPVLNQRHNGYANAYTSDSIDEGFATFWAASMSRVFERDVPGRGNGLFRWNVPSPGNSSAVFLEQNAQVSDPRRPAYSNPVPAEEETAIAGILWDLTDATGDLDSRYGSAFYDTASIGLSEVVSIFRQKPSSLLGLYRAIKSSQPTLAQGAAGQSRLDQIFLMHGAFHDKNGDGRFDPDEEVGRAANATTWEGFALDGGGVLLEKSIGPRPARENLPQIEGSTLSVSLVGPDGTNVPVSLVELSIDCGPGNEALNTRQLLKVSAGNVYFQMPPPAYPATATFRVPGSSAPPLVIDGQTYWSKVPANGSILAHTFVVPADSPQLDNVYPAYAPAGTRVTLTGRNFAPDTAGNTVLFGTERAAIASASATTLHVTVPATAKGGVLDVTVSRSERSSNALEFEVLVPAFGISTRSLAFGDVATGQTSEQSFSVTNSGAAPLTVTSIAASGVFSTIVPVGARTPLTVDPGTSRKITVRMSPVEPGPVTGDLVIATSDPTYRTAVVTLTGNGLASGPGITSTPAGLGFGSVVTGQNRLIPLTVGNSGTSPLTVTSAALSSPAFTLVSATFPFTLAAGASRVLDVRFAPDSAVPYSASLILQSNDPGRPSLVTGLNGTGVPVGTAPQACTYGVTPASIKSAASGSGGSITVTAPAGCAWTASGTASFVTLSPAGGTGSGTVTYQIPANDGGLSRTGKLLVAGVTVDVTQASEGGATTIVPIVLSSSGVGTSYFTSELTLTNRGQSDIVAEMTYTAAFGGGSGTAKDVVPAGSQLVFKDAISYLRSIGIPIPAEENRGGTLRVRFVGGSSAASGSATMRTSSLVPEGRAGLAYAAVPRGMALSGTSYICGLRQNATDRSNVALVNAGKEGEGDVKLRVTVYSGDPAAPSSTVLTDVWLPPGGFHQISGILGANGLSLTNGWVKVEKVEGAAPYYVYGVVNDQANSDGSFIPPVTAEVLSGKKGLSLPVAVEAAPFATELVLTNFGTVARSFRVTFVSDAIEAPENAATVAFDLGPSEQRIVPDFVEYLRTRQVPGVGSRGPTFAGAAFLSVDSGDVSGLFIGARTSSPGGGGQYGVFYSGVPYGAAATSQAYVHGLQQNAENRSNLALVNTGEVDGSADVFTIEIFDGSTGVLSAQIRDIEVGPRRWRQLSGILTQYAPETTSAYVRVTRTAGNNPFIAYGVINDGARPGERTGDGAFVTMDTAE
ncbi:MAG: choice-of-anchor D domain-containing protein [Thermoanaerobaculia bacterium]|nr:choice-of-anchor D domain-containing protein [Thermoanaerobaculia bacterium]